MIGLHHISTRLSFLDMICNAFVDDDEDDNNNHINIQNVALNIQTEIVIVK